NETRMQLSSRNFVLASSLIKRANSMISLASGIDKLEVSSIDDYKSPEAIIDYESPRTTTTNKPPGATTNEPPGATTNEPPEATTNEPPGATTNEPPGASITKDRKEFIEKFLTGNTFNNCVFHF
ncbi:3217_t:CDS:2, partial [Scutellospora calospora]